MTAANAVPPGAHGFLDRHLGVEWRYATAVPLPQTANFVARLDVAGNSFALRVPLLPDAVTRVDRRSEFAAHTAAARASLSPEIVGCDEAAGILLTKWIDGVVWSPERVREPTAIPAIAGAFRRLHAIAPVAELRVIDTEEVIDHYVALLQPLTTDAAGQCRSLHDAARGHLASVGRHARVLCHNDVHYRNVADSPDGILLLDWEYAGLGAPLFDLASFASYQELDADATAAFLRAYGADEAALREFPHWRWLFEYVWALWLTATAGGAQQLDWLLPRLRGDVL